MSWGTLQDAEWGTVLTFVPHPTLSYTHRVYIKQRKLRNGALTKKLAWWVLSEDQDEKFPHVISDYAMAKLVEGREWSLS